MNKGLKKKWSWRLQSSGKKIDLRPLRLLNSPYAIADLFLLPSTEANGSELLTWDNQSRQLKNGDVCHLNDDTDLCDPSN